MKAIFLTMLILLSVLSVSAVMHKISDYEPTLFYELISADVVGNTSYLLTLFTYFEGANWEVTILDTSNPQEIQLLNSFSVNSGAHSITVKDSIAYISSSSGLFIYDVANPQNPQFLNHLSTPGEAKSTVVVGNYAYIAGGSAGLLIVDVFNPQNPQLIGSYNTPGEAKNVSIVNNIAYVADWNAGLQVIDVSNPQNPQLISSWTAAGYTYSVAVADTLAYVTNSITGLNIINMANPQNPVSLSSFAIIGPGAVVIKERKAYVSNSLGMLIIDCYDPHNPMFVCNYDLMEITGMEIQDNFAFIYSLNYGFNIIDVSNLQNQQLLGSFTYPYSYFEYISFSDNIAYIGEAGVYQCWKAVDVTNPFSPQLLGSYEGGYIREMSVVGDKLYVTLLSGLKIYDVSDPRAILLLGIYSNPPGNSINNCAIVGNIAYLILNNFGLIIIDVSNPQNMQILGTYACDGVYRIRVEGSIAYLNYGNSAIKIIDVSDHQNPSLLGEFYPAYGYLNDYAVKGNAIYLTFPNVLIIYDVTDPSLPHLIRTISFNPTSNLWKIKVQDSQLFISDINWNEIYIFNVINNLNPIFLHKYSWNLSTYDMHYANRKLYTVNALSGLNILDFDSFVEGEDQTEILSQKLRISNNPNPFNPNTTLSFDLPYSGDVELEIYNIKGQKIKSLISKHFIAGNHKVMWNGTADNGNSVSSGVYFARMRCGGKITSRKLVLLK